MARAIVAILALGILAMMAVQGFSVGLENAGKNFDVTGESFTPTAGEVTELSRSNIDGAYYKQEVDVVNNTGVHMEPGVDYEWIDENGTIRTIVGGQLDGESNAEIDYSYQVPNNEEIELAHLLGVVPQALGVAAPVLLFALLLVILRS